MGIRTYYSVNPLPPIYMRIEIFEKSQKGGPRFSFLKKWWVSIELGYALLFVNDVWTL